MTVGDSVISGRRRLTFKSARFRWLGSVGLPLSCVGIVITIGLGLLSRKYPGVLPELFGKYPGDALWALMVYLGWATLFPRASVRVIALLALLFAYAIEASQLYQATWLDAIRGTTLGHLVLGSTFVWHDLLAYAVGVAMAVVVDVCLLVEAKDR